jgi:group I intron endonuclease
MSEIERKSSSDKCAVTGIYGLRCKTTNKWYVGQSIDISERWKFYRKENMKSQRKLYAAAKKYGIDNFEFIILETCDNVPWILDYREIYWIKYLDSHHNGYNCTIGGQGFRMGKHSEETKKKMSKNRKGKSLPKEVIEKMIKSRLGKKVVGRALENIRLGCKNRKKREIPSHIASARGKKAWQTRIQNGNIKMSDKAKNALRIKMTGKIQDDKTKEKRRNTKIKKYLNRIEFIDMMEPPTRFCPICCKALFYKSNTTRNKAERKGLVCKSCVQKDADMPERIKHLNMLRANKLSI